MPFMDKYDRFEDHYDRLKRPIPAGARKVVATPGKVRQETSSTTIVEKDKVGGPIRPFLQTLLGVLILSVAPGLTNSFENRHKVVYEQPQVLTPSTYPQPTPMPEAKR